MLPTPSHLYLPGTINSTGTHAMLRGGMEEERTAPGIVGVGLLQGPSAPLLYCIHFSPNAIIVIVQNVESRVHAGDGGAECMNNLYLPQRLFSAS